MTGRDAHVPRFLPVIAHAIPLELQELDRWVAWRAEWRVNRQGIGKWTKVPFQVNGRPASSTDATTWSTFAAVLAAYRADRFAGIGWVLQRPFCGIDIDDAFDQSGQLKPDARRWVLALDSYTERSVSGTGVHVICHADLPEFGHKRGAFEAYNTGRFFTVNGHHVEVPR